MRHPLREPTFRALWTASLASNLGTWIQNVSGAWLMTTLTTEPLPVALMQTATTLPSFLLSLPAGALADRVERRRLLLVTQGWMLATASVLSVLTYLNLVSPWLLLLFTFSLGVGWAASGPAFSSLIQDVVSRQQMPTAVTLNSLGFNLARATGPTIGGILVAASGPATAFALNGVSFLATITVLWRWRPGSTSAPRKRLDESFMRTLRVGVEYAWQAPAQRVVLGRSVLWMLGASVLWALLPLVARDTLGLEAQGYGFLVTCAGVGAVIGAFNLPRLRERWATNTLQIACVVLFAATLVVLAWVVWLPLVWAMLAVGGAAWTCSNQNFQIAVQLSAPAAIRARAIALYLVTFQGGQAIGSPIWGWLAGRVGESMALTVAAVFIVLGLIAAVRWPVVDES